MSTNRQTASLFETLPPPSIMQRALREGDAAFDGVFVTAVRTTGVFCRPSCPARKPRAENVEFFATPKDALFAGYRPCLRCRPLDAPGKHPPEVARAIEEVERNPEARLKDADLRALGVSPERLRRYFQKRFGMTFQTYSRGRRLGAAFLKIRGGADLEDVTLGHGYDSHSGFREAFRKLFDDPPGRARAREALVASWIEGPLGPMVAAAADDGVCLLEFTDRRMLEAQLRTIRSRFGRPIAPGTNDHLEKLRDEMARYFAGTLRSFTVPVVAPGTPFQEKVWAELRRIPYGATRSYEEVARRIGQPGAVRAVGRANGMNRIAVVVPCHRVVNARGELGGYGGGLWRKHWLLRLEKNGAPGAASA
jgi:AraC family transcriptional regulator of adaptative response/methylated-DNA-[protein]-cysteine methyltransferase